MKPSPEEKRNADMMREEGRLQREEWIPPSAKANKAPRRRPSGSRKYQPGEEVRLVGHAAKTPFIVISHVGGTVTLRRPYNSKYKFFPSGGRQVSAMCVRRIGEISYQRKGVIGAERRPNQQGQQ